jgi:Ca-activated chloride channel family protein
MTLDPNDPRLTAYVLGELDPAESELIERLLKESEEGRKSVDQIRQTAGWLALELRHELETHLHQPSPLLNHKPVAPIVLGGAAPSTSKSWWRRNGYKFGSLAALSLLGSGLMFLRLAPRGGPGPVLDRLAVAEAEARPGPRGAEDVPLLAPMARESSPAVPPQPKVVMAELRRLDESAAAAGGEFGVTPAVIVSHSVRRRSVVRDSAALGRNLTLAIDKANPPLTYSYYSVQGEGQSAQSLTKRAGSGQQDLAKQEPLGRVTDRPAGMGGMMTARGGVQQKDRKVPGPPAALSRSRAATPPGGAMGVRRARVTESESAKAGAAVPNGKVGRAEDMKKLDANALTDGNPATASAPNPPMPIQDQERAASPTPTGRTKAMASAPERLSAVPKDLENSQPPLALSTEGRSLPRSTADSADLYAKQKAQGEGASRFRSVGQAPQSTFLIDTDRVSFSEVRHAVDRNRLPARDDVRIEELVNELPYRGVAPSPSDAEPLSVGVEIAGCPWDERHRLARIDIAARPIDQRARPACNFVFLVDVSPSMGEPDRLPLVRWGINRFIDQLGERDRLGIVMFGPSTGTVLPSTNGLAKAKIRRAVDDLKVQSPNSTPSGFALAYKVAQEGFLKGGTNRVILATDDASRVQAMRPDDSLRLAPENAGSAISLCWLDVSKDGVGANDKAALGDTARGHYVHVRSPGQAYRALVEETGAKLGVVATDAKVQVQFNTNAATAYRLLGDDIASAPAAAAASIDDAPDAGAIFEGHHSTAVYEIVPTPADLNLADRTAERSVEKLPEVGDKRLAMLSVGLSYKRAGDGQATMIMQAGFDRGIGFSRASDGFKLAAAAAGFGLLLRQSAVPEQLSYDLLQKLIEPYVIEGRDPTGCYREFAELVGKAKGIASPTQR